MSIKLDADLRSFDDGSFNYSSKPFNENDVKMIVNRSKRDNEYIFKESPMNEQGDKFGYTTNSYFNPHLNEGVKKYNNDAYESSRRPVPTRKGQRELGPKKEGMFNWRSGGVDYNQSDKFRDRQAEVLRQSGLANKSTTLPSSQSEFDLYGTNVENVSYVSSNDGHAIPAIGSREALNNAPFDDVNETFNWTTEIAVNDSRYDYNTGIDGIRLKEGRQYRTAEERHACVREMETSDAMRNRRLQQEMASKMFNKTGLGLHKQLQDTDFEFGQEALKTETIQTSKDSHNIKSKNLQSKDLSYVDKNKEFAETSIQTESKETFLDDLAEARYKSGNTKELDIDYEKFWYDSLTGTYYVVDEDNLTDVDRVRLTQLTKDNSRFIDDLKLGEKTFFQTVGDGLKSFLGIGKKDSKPTPKKSQKTINQSVDQKEFIYSTTNVSEKSDFVVTRNKDSVTIHKRTEKIFDGDDVDYDLITCPITALPNELKEIVEKSSRADQRSAHSQKMNQRESTILQMNRQDFEKFDQLYYLLENLEDVVGAHKIQSKVPLDQIHELMLRRQLDDQAIQEKQTETFDKTIKAEKVELDENLKREKERSETKRQHLNDDYISSANQIFNSFNYAQANHETYDVSKKRNQKTDVKSQLKMLTQEWN